MADKVLQKLNRRELLELLLEQNKQLDTLRAENEALKAQLADRRIRLQNVGSIAQAAMQLTGIFETAQKAADLYLQEIRAIYPPASPQLKSQPKSFVPHGRFTVTALDDGKDDPSA